jgi:hypothetical protein
MNYIGILLAAIVSMVLGFFWYSPMLLGKPWMRERGFTADSLKKTQKEMGKLYGLSFVVSLITAYILSQVLHLSIVVNGNSGLGTGVVTGFMMWLGFMMPVQITATIFSDKKNWTLFAIDTGYQLISIIGMGIVLALL